MLVELSVILVIVPPQLRSPKDEQAFFFYLHCQKLGSWLGVRNVRVRANEASARDRHEYLFGLFPGHYRRRSGCRQPSPFRPSGHRLYQQTM